MSVEDNEPSPLLTIVKWCFLAVGLVAIYVGAIPAIWIAWLAALVTSLLAVSRRWQYAVALLGFTVIAVLVFLLIDAAMRNILLAGLPFADSVLAIVPTAGITVATLFALMARDGRYRYQHNAWESENPFSRTWVTDELRRRDRDRAQETPRHDAP
jgi:NADH:ubiquinone oxidoreductase subunit 6 (subunit J)